MSRGRCSAQSWYRTIAWALAGSWLLACGGLSNDHETRNRAGDAGSTSSAGRGGSGASGGAASSGSTSTGGTSSSGGSGGGGRAGAASGGASGEAATGGVAGQAGSGSGGTAGRSLEEICTDIAASAQGEIYRIISRDQPCETDSDCTRMTVRKSCAWLCPTAGSLQTAAEVEEFTLTSCQEFDGLGCPEVIPPLCPNWYAACVEGSCEEVPG